MLKIFLIFTSFSSQTSSHAVFALQPGPSFPFLTHRTLKTCLLLLLLLPNHCLTTPLPQPKLRTASPWRSSRWRARRPLSRRRKKKPSQWRRSMWPRRRSRCCRANWPDWLYRLGRLVRSVHTHIYTFIFHLSVQYRSRSFSLTEKKSNRKNLSSQI